jgi:cytochrome c oxidase subunit 1
MPRRMASYDYANPAIAPQALSVSISVFGGLLLVVSAGLFFAVLIRGHRAPQSHPGIYRFSVAVHEPVRIPVALNGFALWLTLMIGLTVVNYGFPIAQLLAIKDNAVPAVYVGAAR